jgi:hypothetical protein
MTQELNHQRKVVFISKATPGDDEFVLWLAPRLEAEGYEVFADILALDAGDRWRKTITSTLQDKSIKMLLCCCDTTLDKVGVQEEIGIALDLAKELKDEKFIIPLRLEKYKKIFGIGELQYIDFSRGWAGGLHSLLDQLDKQNVPKDTENRSINTEWDKYRKKLAIAVENIPEKLISNWLRVKSLPDYIHYFEPTGAVNHDHLKQAIALSKYPIEQRFRGFFSYATLDEINAEFSNAGKFIINRSIVTDEFLENGCESPSLHPREAKKLMSSLLRQSWEQFCKEKEFGIYPNSSMPAFYATENKIAVGKKVSWRNGDKKRYSMLRNSSGGKVWQFGLSAIPALWPFIHFKMKSRVIFAELLGNKISGNVIDAVSEQHRLRRGVCSTWRNKQWHGRLMAFLDLLSEGTDFINLPLSPSNSVCLEALPMIVESPVSTALPNTMDEDEEEQDLTTLGNLELDEDEI